jgi:hypothetical protein
MQGNGIKSFNTYEENPFEVYGVTTKQVTKKGEELTLTMPSGREMGLKKLPSSKVVVHDPAQYIKLFKASLLAIANLDKRGVILLMFIADIIKPKADYVFLKQTEASAFHQSLSGSSFYTAISNLLKYGVMVRSDIRDKYFINPNIIFNGDRRKSKYVKKPR